MSVNTFITVHRDVDKQKRDYWRRVQSVRDRFEGKFHNYFRKVLFDQFKELANKITPDNMGSPLLIESITRDPIKKGFYELYGQVGSHFAQNTYTGLKHAMTGYYTKQEEPPIDEWYEDMMWYVNNKAGLRIVSITAETRRQAIAIIQGVLAQSTTQGWGAEETARQVRKMLESKGQVLSQWRALRIARTEIVTASNTGAIIGARDLNVPLQKFWIATYDSRTRDTHAIVEQQNPKRMDEGFMVGAYLMEMPGDPDAGPEETINCRCTVAFEVKEL